MAISIIPRFLGTIPMDAVIRERHQSELRITRNPVEMGADVTDHAYVEPKKLTLEAVCAGSSSSAAEIAASYEAIVRLQETREPFSIVTGLTVYRNMLIENVEVDRDKENARVLFFSADLLEVIIVDTESSPSEGDNGSSGNKSTKQSNLSKNKLAKGSTSDRGSPTVNRGNTTAPEANLSGSSPAAIQNRSFLHKSLGIGDGPGTIKAGSI